MGSKEETVWTCDRCPNHTVGVNAPTWGVVRVTQMKTQALTLDLCESCLEVLRAWLEHKVKGNDRPTEEPSE